MSRADSNALGSDSPIKAILNAKAAHSNAKLTRKVNQRELRHDTMNVSLVVEPNRFLDLFVPEPPPPLPEKKARYKPSNPFTNIAKPTTERTMYEDYPKLLNKITRGSGYAFVATPYKADNATDSNLAVDCGMYPRTRMPKKDQMKGMDKETKKDFRHVCWSGIDLPVECKVEEDPFEDSVNSGRPFSDKRKDACGQALSYVELTYHHQNRTFVFMLIFIGVHCRLLRVDRSGLFVTKRFDVTNTDYLVEFLWRYTQLSPEDRGYDTTAEYINPSPKGHDPLAKMMRQRLSEVEKSLVEADSTQKGKKSCAKKGEESCREEEHIVELWKESLDEKRPWWKLRVTDEQTGRDRYFLTGKPCFQAPGVRGRGTRCHITVELLTDRNGSRSLAKNLVFLKDCWRVVVDAGGDDAEEIQQEGKTLEKLNNAKVAHVPTLVVHGDVRGQDTKAPDAWKKINDKHKCRLKNHQHYRLVVKEIGKPLSKFKNSGQLILAMHDCLQAHGEACDIGIMHRDISGGNILLYKDARGDWRGLLTDWELSKDFHKDAKPRQVGRTGTLQFSAARVLDDPSKTVCVADEIECFFHVLIYYAVRFLQHNVPEKLVDLFLNNYFDVSSGCTQAGELTAPALKRASMESGRIPLDFCGLRADSLQFMWVDDPPKSLLAPRPPPDYDHPLNELLSTLLSWFRALYTLDVLDRPAPVVLDSTQANPAPADRDGEVAFTFRDDDDDDDEPEQYMSRPEPLSPEELKKLEERAAKLGNHAEVLDLLKAACMRGYPRDKGEDKRPEKRYTPRSPETPELDEIPGFTDTEEEDDDQIEGGCAAVPDALSPEDFAQLAASADRGWDEHRAPAVPAALNLDDLEYHDDSSRSPSPCPIRPQRASTRPKRGREDDADREDDASRVDDVGREDSTAPRTSGKRSRY